jgi:hypothetical protein
MHRAEKLVPTTGCSQSAKTRREIVAATRGHLSFDPEENFLNRLDLLFLTGFFRCERFAAGFFFFDGLRFCAMGDFDFLFRCAEHDCADWRSLENLQT